MQVLTPVFLPYLQVKQEELPRWYHRVPHNLSTICLWTAIVNGLDLPFALSVAVYGFKRVHGSMLNNRCVTLLTVNCRICIGINSMIWSDIWHKYHEWYFEIAIRNFTRLTAREIRDNFESHSTGVERNSILQVLNNQRV